MISASRDLPERLIGRFGDQQRREVAEVVGMGEHHPEGGRIALMRIHDDVFADRIRQRGQELGAVDGVRPRLDLIEREGLARQTVVARLLAASRRAF